MKPILTWLQCATAAVVFQVHAEVASSWFPSKIVSVDYPLLGQQARIAGRVVLDCTIGEDGVIAQTTVKSGHNLLSQAILDKLPEWRFSRQNGADREATNLVLEFEFRLVGVTRKAGKSVFVYEYPNRFTVESHSLWRTH